MRVSVEGNCYPPSRSTTLHDVYTSCSGARDEVWFAAKEIQRLLDDGVPPSGDYAVNHIAA